MPAIPPPPRKAAAVACAAALLFAGSAPAQMPFASFGGRSVALGGASVGLGPDVAAAIDNPAAAPDRNFAFTVSAGLLMQLKRWSLERALFWSIQPSLLQKIRF